MVRIVLETSSAFSPQFYEPGYELALGNAVAAMPSVHAGVTTIVALAAWGSGHRALRAGAVAYALTMGFALVYLGEHYVVDLLAGALLALVTWSASSAWWRRHDRARADEEGLLAMPAGLTAAPALAPFGVRCPVMDAVRKMRANAFSEPALVAVEPGPGAESQ